MQQQERYRSKYSTKNCQQMKFYLPVTLEESLCEIPGANRRAKIIEAIEEYLAIDFEQRKKPAIRATGSNKVVSLLCPKELLAELNDLVPNKSLRSRLIIAAIEMYAEKRLK